MQYFGFALLASTAFVAAVPLPASTSPAAPCPSITIKEDQSTTFGWQLVGTSDDASALDQTCSQIKNRQLSKWSDVGLSLAQVQSPVCDAVASSASDTLPQVVTANTKSVTTLFTAAFKQDDTETFSYLCDNLRNKQVAGFLLDGPTILNATCARASQQLNPQPFTTTPVAEVNATAVAAYSDAQSKLYAYLYAAQASTSEQLSSLCEESRSGEKQANYKALALDPACVSQTICSMREPLSVEEGQKQFKQLSSVSFANVIVHSSNVPGYAQKLCEKLDVESLETAGLDGELVKMAACNSVA